MRNLFSKLKPTAQNESVFECEIEALMKHDIPYFSANINSTTLIGNMNKNIDNFFKENGSEVIINKLKNFNTIFLSFQEICRQKRRCPIR
mgnify:CR=1 FL=1